MSAMRRAASMPDFAQVDGANAASRRSVPPTVLIVDDSSFNLKIVSRVVRALFTSARVVTANDGREGVQKYKELRAKEPDEKLAMIVMDFNMPNVDGVTAARYIRALEEMNLGEEFKRESAGEGSNASSQSAESTLSIEGKTKVKCRRVPIVMYTTELQVVLPALIEGVIDDRIPKICSKELFHTTLVRHLHEEFAPFVQPCAGYDRNRAHSENDMADIMLETGTWELDELYGSLDAVEEANDAKEGRKRGRKGNTLKSKYRRGGNSDVIDLSDASTRQRSRFFARFPQTLRKFFGKRQNKTPRDKMNERGDGAAQPAKSTMFSRIQSEDNSRYRHAHP